MIHLGDILRRVERFEPRDGMVEYPFAGTYSFARGIFVGERKVGSSFSLPKVQRIREGDFIYCKIMAWEGAFGLVPKEADGCVMSGAFVVYKPDRVRIEPKFLDYYFKVPRHWKAVGTQSTGTNVRRQSLHPSQFEKFEIPLPPLSEQRRIVARIEELAAKIDEARVLRQKAAEGAELVARLFANRLFNSISESRPIEAIADVRGGIQKSPERVAGANPVRYLTVAHVQRNQVLTHDVRYFEVTIEELDRWRLLPGDVLIIEGNGSAEQIGRTALFRGEIENCVHQNHVIRIRPEPNRLDSEYLNSYLNSPAGQDAVQAQSRTTSGLRTLSVGRIKQIQVPVPPLSEQRRIVAEVNNFQSQVDGLKKLQSDTAAELGALLPSVLDKAFKGQL